MNKILKLAVTTIISLHTLSTASAQWRQKASNTTENLTAACFVSPTTGFACGAYNTLIKTTDGGGNWQPVNNAQIPLTSFTAIDALSSANVFVGRKGLYVSEDGGSNWTQWGALSNYAGSIFAIKAINDSTAFVLKNGSILKTTNKGASWFTIYTALHLAGPLQFTGHNDTVYAVSGITYDAISEGTIHKSVDGGNTWTDLNMTGPQIIALYFRTPRIGYYAAFGNSLYKTMDGAATWTAINSPVRPDSDYITAIRFLDDTIGYVATYNGVIYKTVNGGVIWTKDYVGAGNPGAPPLTALVGLDSRNVIAIGNEGTVLKNDKSLSIPTTLRTPVIAYPNPVIKDLTLEVGQTSPFERLLIHDAAGKTVCAIDIQGKPRIVVDMHQYGSGTYFVEMQGPAERETLQVIVR